MFPSLLSRAARSAAPLQPTPRTIERALCALLLLLLAQTAALGQEGATLSGRVLDATDGAAVGFATVVVEHADSGETLTGALTGEDGRFLVQGLAQAEYTIWVSFPGYLTAETDFVIVSPGKAGGFNCEPLEAALDVAATRPLGPPYGWLR